ncbi:formylglycine-generating enzyme family protein [Inquilinus sp. NPDC058860]|uniref:formylglycine-generating enzyme family protein n=1 Tax=Inquilinus sp. NPDC058860 TaxID=3346652 RepID=UPI00367B511C
MSDRPLWFAAALAAALVLSASAAAETTWPAEAYNPAPHDGDVLLPMPCGGAMAFRRIDLPSAGFLDDVRVQVGDAQSDLGFLDDRRFDEVAGSFTDPDIAGVRSFLLGKYEITQAQWQALAGDGCPETSMRMRVPKTGISWLDAVAFADRYSQWLLANARDALPNEAGSPGFLRLPTETEWEYAARGGMAVSAEEFLAARFPMPDGTPAEYLWYQGTGSAEGRLHPIGLLKPNPLGLHDILGNAAEMMVEPFRLNRRGRLHGQAGGFIARGGDFTMPLAQIRSGMRVEMPYYAARDGRPTATRQLGLRLVVAAPVIASPERLQAIEREWLAMPSAGIATASARREDDALSTLDRLADTAPDDAMRTDLRGVGQAIREALVERNDARNRTIRSLINVGALLGNKLRTDQQRLDAVSKAIEEVARPALRQMQARRANDAETQRMVAQAEASIRQMEGQRDALADTVRTSRETYIDTVVSTANDYSDEIVSTQVPTLKAELQARASTGLLPFVDIFVLHMQRMRQSGGADPQSLVDDLTR